MWVDSDVLKTELSRLVREAGEEFDESEDLLMLQALISGEITAYKKVEQMLDEHEEVQREEGNEE